jgi:hypothetical protein
MRRRTRRFDLAGGAILVAVAALAYGVNAATANPVVVSVAVPQGQTLRQLIAGTFVEKLRCSVSCRATTNLVLSGKLARRLQFPGAKSSLPYGISLIDARLRANRWTTVRLRAGEQARILLSKSKAPIRIDGVIYAQAAVSPAKKGATGWSQAISP